MKRRDSQHGVTLLEMLVAVAILGTIATLLYGTFGGLAAGREYADQHVRGYAHARAALAFIRRDLKGMGNTGIFPRGPRLLVSSGTTEGPTEDGSLPPLELTTSSSLGKAPLEKGLPQGLGVSGPMRGEDARVMYRLEAETDAGRTDLVRYEWRPALRLAGNRPSSRELEEDRKRATRSVIARGVSDLKFRFSNNGSVWFDDWNRRGTLPRLIETTIAIEADEAPLTVLSSLTFIQPRQEP